MPDKYFGFGKQAELGFQFVSSLDKQGFPITEADDGHNIIVDEVDCELSLMEEREMLRGDFVPNKEKFGKEFEKFALVGTLARIDLDLSAEINFESLISSFKEIKLKGLKRIKIVNLEKKDELWQGEYQELLEKELDQETTDKLTEKFVRHLPNILEKAKLISVEKLPYESMMKVSLDLQERLDILINLPDRKKINEDLNRETREEIRRQQEEYYLSEEQKAIERRLKKLRGYGDEEMRRYSEKLIKEPYPEYVKKVACKQIEYCENFELVRRNLNEKYYGSPEIKDKIIEYLGDLKKSNEPSGKVLCLVGPPGVGKTFFASCVAEATGRKKATISMGGAHDVAKIKGHCRTYIGSFPGEIARALRKTGVINPLILIDEVDKIGRDGRGDPSYALLEVLDPNENKNFVDDYLGSEEIDIEDQAILKIIRCYTQEAGVRELDRKIKTIFDKFNVQVEEKKITNLVVTPEIISQKEYFGKEIYDFTHKEDNAPPGVVNGEGKLGKLTGSLGKVMKESAEVAFSYVQHYLRENKENFEKELVLLEENDFNIHAPEGAVEKEGPSAGVTLTTAILSALTKKKIPSDIGMTGEITSKGKILKIGGLKEKAIAAHRSGLKLIIIPKANERDIEDIPSEIRQDLKIVLVEEYEKVWKTIFRKRSKSSKVLPKNKRPEIGKRFFTIKNIYQQNRKISQLEKIKVSGWVKSVRQNKFIELNDGSCLPNLQLICPPELTEKIKQINFGSSLIVSGKLILTPTRAQSCELKVENIELVNPTVDNYPLQKKNIPLEVVRNFPHLRAKTNYFLAIFRLRHTISKAIHDFFHQTGFYYVSTPIITGSDTEGAGELFSITTSDKEPFFPKTAKLTVSGQLQAEALTQGLGKPEMAFADLNKITDLAEKLVKYVIEYVLDNNNSELKYLEVYEGEENKKEIIRIDLQSEHEKYLCQYFGGKPVFVVNYPTELKALYMKNNPGGKTVACFDLLFPEIGELMGGSVREDNYQTLKEKAQKTGLDINDLAWYLDLRKCGYAPSGGFGLGLERLIMFISGTENIRDTIAFPRFPGKLEF
ncbi:2947_t:CDS:10 [Funneliformis geosporum]|uniref:2947_t:CDS:1 n=1 Tax=Funneliformis geosporum TaxID=1117311 RepID=A0A9W4SB88_9GLOM|nr:2947_t:CDS:10 [Funneliformis geosporum]